MRSQGIWKASGHMSRIQVKENSKMFWTMHTSQCTRLSREYPHMYAVIGEKAAYINIVMFLGMIKVTSKDNNWSIGANESAGGQGKAIQCLIHLVW